MRASFGIDELVKLEVIGDPKTPFPDNAATVEARAAWSEGFKSAVLPGRPHTQAARKRAVSHDAARGADRSGPAFAIRTTSGSSSTTSACR
jgi:hypothetical protein